MGIPQDCRQQAIAICRLQARLLAACRERDMALSQAATLGEHLGSVMQPVMSTLECSMGQDIKAHANGSASPRQSASAQVSLIFAAVEICIMD